MSTIAGTTDWGAGRGKKDQQSIPRMATLPLKMKLPCVFDFLPRMTNGRRVLPTAISYAGLLRGFQLYGAYLAEDEDWTEHTSG